MRTEEQRQHANDIIKQQREERNQRSVAAKKAAATRKANRKANAARFPS